MVSVTEAETSTLVGFLVGGLLTGVIGGWVDLLVAYVKGR